MQEMAGWIPGSGRSPGEGNGNSLQYSCLEDTMDRGAWWATVHGLQRVGHDLVTKQQHSLARLKAAWNFLVKVGNWAIDSENSRRTLLVLV